METAALDRIQQALEAHPGVQDWTLRETQQDSTQLYLIKTEPEAVRLAHTMRYDLDIYHDHDGGRGAAGISLQPGELGLLAARLDEAVYLAGLTHNPPYTLPPAAATYPAIESWDAAIGTPAAAAQVARDLAAEVRVALADETGVRLSSMELFLDSATIVLRTSTGVAATRQGTRAECELVVTSHDAAGAESEAHDLWTRRRAADLDPAGRAVRQAGYARDSLRATLPPAEAALVVLPAETMLPFFEAVAFRSSAGARYRDATPWQVGAPIAERSAEGGPFDRLDLASDATLPYGLETRAFDDGGLPARRFSLISDGRLQRYWAGQRYADYLGIEATGGVANWVPAPGLRAAAALLQPGDRPLIEVVTFSWLNPDDITGEFVGEIRLGYRITRDGRVPIKGGAVSGNVFAALLHAQFSRETVRLGNYEGPAVCRFHGLDVAG